MGAWKDRAVLFTQLARRAGARDGYSRSAATPAIDALVARGRDKTAIRLPLDDGGLIEVSRFPWSDVAHLATSAAPSEQ